jgi:hypothetical protein
MERVRVVRSVGDGYLISLMLVGKPILRNESPLRSPAQNCGQLPGILAGCKGMIQITFGHEKKGLAQTTAGGKDVTGREERRTQYMNTRPPSLLA